MKIKIIAAMARNRVIGNDGLIPWKIPNEMRFFSRTTRESVVVMGHTTWKSLNVQPLPSRINVVLSRQDHPKPTSPLGPFFIRDVGGIDDVPRGGMEHFFDNIFVIGGTSVYRHFLEKNLVDEIILSEIDQDIPGDSRFPEFNGFELGGEEQFKEFKVSHYFKKR